MIPIRDWPAHEQPRERLLTQGPASLSNAELLAIFLRTGTPGLTAVDLARKILNEFGGLRQLFSVSLEEFSAIQGLGCAKYAHLHASLELSKRYLGESLQRGETISTAKQVHDFLRSHLRDLPHEEFCAMYLNSRHQFIEFKRIFRGSLTGAAVHPRQIVKDALQLNAAAVIFAHNHPSGNAEPSLADQRITRDLRQSLALIEVRVLDHLVVGENIISFAERGWL